MKFILAVISLMVLVGCAGNRKEQSIEVLSICSEGVCVAAQRDYSQEQMFMNLEAFIKANEGLDTPICVASPDSKICSKEKVCYLVMGGLIPGSGCAKSLTFSNVAATESASIEFETTMPLSFIGTKVSCGSAVSRFSVNSINEVTLELDAYHCSWMVIGQMQATFSFRVESIDIDKGVLGGYWKHGVTGTGNGRGTGYALLTFRNNIDWTKSSTTEL